MEETKETFSLCYCGNPENDHYFRHIFEPKIKITKYSNDEGDRFETDANDWPAKKHVGSCSFPQCSAGEPLHGTIIKHEFKPKENYEWHEISFKLPLNTRCRVCKEFSQDHESLTHHFTTKVDVVNKGARDVIVVHKKKACRCIGGSCVLLED